MLERGKNRMIMFFHFHFHSFYMLLHAVSISVEEKTVHKGNIEQSSQLYDPVVHIVYLVNILVFSSLSLHQSHLVSVSHPKHNKNYCLRCIYSVCTCACAFVCVFKWIFHVCFVFLPVLYTHHTYTYTHIIQINTYTSCDLRA